MMSTKKKADGRQPRQELLHNLCVVLHLFRSHICLLLLYTQVMYETGSSLVSLFFTHNGTDLPVFRNSFCLPSEDTKICDCWGKSKHVRFNTRLAESALLVPFFFSLYRRTSLFVLLLAWLRISSFTTFHGALK